MTRVRIEHRDSLDLCARKVLMSSLLYYSLSQPIVSDGEFDDWCRRLARNWDRLSPIRQWQLGDPDDLLESAFDVCITTACVGGATSWLDHHGKLEGRTIELTRDWRVSKRWKVRYLYAEEFRWA